MADVVARTYKFPDLNNAPINQFAEGGFPFRLDFVLTAGSDADGRAIYIGGYVLQVFVAPADVGMKLNENTWERTGVA